MLAIVFSQVSHVVAAPIAELLGNHHGDEPTADDVSLWLYLSVAAVLVLLGGAFAGLTIA